MYSQDTGSVEVRGANYYLYSGVLNATIFETEVFRVTLATEEQIKPLAYARGFILVYGCQLLKKLSK